MEFEKKVAEFISDTGLFASGGKVLLAVSGGADSTALLCAMTNLVKKNILKNEFLCAHINHRLRGAESDADEKFVVSLCRKLNLPVVTRSVDVRAFARQEKISIETAARQLRIANLAAIAKDNDCNLIAAAHHKDDNAETMVQRLARGTGFRGLCGIWPVKEFAGGVRFVRPLLSVTRDEILQYLNAKNLAWRHDSSNDDCSYRRNFIRHRLMPLLQKDSGIPIADLLFELSRSSQKFCNLVSKEAEKAWRDLARCEEQTVSLNAEAFAGQHPAVKVELIRLSLLKLGSGERDLTEAHYQRIEKLARKKRGNEKVMLPGFFTASREGGQLIFSKSFSEQPLSLVKTSREINIPGRTNFGDYTIEADIITDNAYDVEKFKAGKDQFVERFDMDKLKLPLIIRSHEAGDRFWPIGLTGEKKVGKFLTSEKVPFSFRKRIVIVTDNEKIIWVCPVRISESVKITEHTRRVLELKITAKSSRWA